MNTELTEREREYLACDTEMITRSSAVIRLTTGMVTMFFRAIFVPSSEYNKTDYRFTRTIREIQYTKYKKAVLRKQSDASKPSDERVLRKLNRVPFVLEEDTYDPDRYIEEIYAEYMKNHPEKGD